MSLISSLNTNQKIKRIVPLRSCEQGGNKRTYHYLVVKERFRPKNRKNKFSDKINSPQLDNYLLFVVKINISEIIMYCQQLKADGNSASL